MLAFLSSMGWNGRVVGCESKLSYALHTEAMPSSCGIFVHGLVTSIDTRNVFLLTFVFSMKLIKSRWCFRNRL